MFKLFSPTFQAESLDGILIERLVRDGIRGLIIDLDNTMTPGMIWRSAPRYRNGLPDCKMLAYRVVLYLRISREDE